MHRKRRRDRRRLRKLKTCLSWLKPVTERPPGLDSHASEAAGDDDRLWFESHPKATWRLRPGLEGELGSPNPRWVLSFQFVPGARMRVPIGENLTDEQIRRMGEFGQFELVDGFGPVWFPATETAKAMLADGTLALPSQWVNFGSKEGDV